MPRKLSPHWNSNGPAIGRAERDIAAIGITFAALVLFVGTGSSVLIRMARHWLFGEINGDTVLTSALLLNIALIVFGWRRYVDMKREIAVRREAEEAALRLADTDPLTGLKNRRGFDATLAHMTQVTAQTGGSLALILIDLDRFKHANDAHGHHTGDAVLIEAAKRAQSMLGAQATLARLGGDEFAALVPFAPGADAREPAERIAARIGAAIALPIECGGNVLLVTASIGVACDTISVGVAGDTIPVGVASDTIPVGVASDTMAPGRADTFGKALMHQADVAMYQAKKTGRNRHCWFDPAMETAMLERGRMERAIRLGLKNGEFRPHYEKQVDLANGAITGLEMLARWNSPEHGVVGPDVFVPIAEDIGVMPELSETLIRQALDDAREWAPHLTLAINISPVQLRDPWFAQRLLKLLIEARIPAHRIDVEITEQCLTENLTLVRSLITSLRNQGVRISLDDFGHSASSMAHLRTLPFDRIKIDRNFIAGLGQSRDSATVVKAITAMGRGMDLPITAEGIESAEILAELRKLGAFRGQGYVYGQPLCAEDLRRELTALDLMVAIPGEPVVTGDRHRA